MRVTRLYLPVVLQKGASMFLDDDSAHYVRTVLRIKQSAAITVFNGQGGEYSAIVTEINRKRIKVKIGNWSDCSIESPLNLIYGLAISRSEKMDFAVQKSVELGVSEITPLLTERCVVKIKDAKKKQKMRHWQTIAQHASEQCGRTVVTEIFSPEDFEHWVNRQHGLKVFLDPHAKQFLNELRPDEHKVTLLSGPEGGFTNEEKHLAKQAGFIAIRLGCRILRTETAALAAIAAAQTLWGDFCTPQG